MRNLELSHFRVDAGVEIRFEESRSGPSTGSGV
jgi:hypothetical protein